MGRRRRRVAVVVVVVGVVAVIIGDVVALVIAGEDANQARASKMAAEMIKSEIFINGASFCCVRGCVVVVVVDADVETSDG